MQFTTFPKQHRIFALPKLRVQRPQAEKISNWFLACARIKLLMMMLHINGNHKQVKAYIGRTLLPFEVNFES
ncbi:hypothetical protein F8388_013833 [Cannabis sativa]|uniref:Uncharacterized protein n=1 Tax=Cannabis sativa TaxID=3483 RepID=A0A7J6E9C1_CANSA|nr:hypothetical protein F8388_013833 [Cannabis sativa]KAF4404317.1 hypothetical protein G4B88_014773 [Cannabis sativa]